MESLWFDLERDSMDLIILLSNIRRNSFNRDGTDILRSKKTMKKYHKIQTVYKRDPETKFKTLLEGDFSLPEFMYLANNTWDWTEKVDGTNIRIMYENGDIEFRGKTDNAQLPAKLVKRLNTFFLPKVDIFTSLFGNTPTCLYGEGYGAGIQKGGKYRPDQDFVMFDVNVNDWWLERDNVEDVADNLGVDTVYVIGSGTLYEMVEYVKKGFNSAWGDFIAEGIVARPQVGLQTRGGDRIITKLKYKDFK